MNNKKVFIALAIISCLAFNYVAQSGGSPFVLIVGQILYFFSLYKISVLSKENGWYAAFGLLNILGLIIVLFIARSKNKPMPTNQRKSQS